MDIKGIIVRGKNASLKAVIAFIWHSQNDTIPEMKSRVVIEVGDGEGRDTRDYVWGVSMREILAGLE